MDFRTLFEKTISEALKLLQNPTWTAKDFCHYTSLQGLIGILESNEIWLSDHRFVNDKHEYEYGRALAISVISEAMQTEADDDFRKFLIELSNSFTKTSPIGIYIASMSFSPDKLDQWKGYGNSNESVCIKFAGDFELWNTGHTHPTHIRQQTIIYDEKQQIQLIKKIIQPYKENFEAFKNFTYPFLIDLSGLIQSQFILFKHREYASENELRITIANLGQILRKKKPMHRIAKGMIVPYITTKYISTEADPPLNKLPIKEIVVSPTSNPDLLESLKVFVTNMGYTDIKVVESAIKFRG
ncbi:MAG: DUF2971 domain-containing protein [Oxalobacter sp.]|nr:MAG: DUF2971 domain-containing protein [Oxalobacter sp.]